MSAVGIDDRCWICGAKHGEPHVRECVTAECICYPGMCPMGCEPACPYCFVTAACPPPEGEK